MAVYRHRLTTSTAAVVDDPSCAELAALVAEVDRSGRGAFLVLERRDKPRGDSLQALRQAGHWVLELRVGSHEACRTTLPGPALVLATLGAWMRETPGRCLQNWALVPGDDLGAYQLIPAG